MPVFIKGLISVLLCICTVSGSSLPDVAPQMERYHVEKAGMTKEACLREIYKTRDGDFTDLYLYSILHHEWETMEKGESRL